MFLFFLTKVKLSSTSHTYSSPLVQDKIAKKQSRQLRGGHTRTCALDLGKYWKISYNMLSITQIYALILGILCFSPIYTTIRYLLVYILFPPNIRVRVTCTMIFIAPFLFIVLSIYCAICDQLLLDFHCCLV